MFAILETGGKQYKVTEGDILEIELVDKENISQNGETIFNTVLLLSDNDLKIGRPYIKDAVIKAKVLEKFKAPKIIVFKKKSKKQYRKTQGHRQELHRIQIEKIVIQQAVKPKAEKTIETKTKTVTKPKSTVKTKPKKETKTAAKSNSGLKTATKKTKEPKTKAKTMENE